MKNTIPDNSQIINGIAFGFSAAFLLAAVCGALYTGEGTEVFHGWYLILISPCPLVTDYFAIGGLGSAFLNAAACGFSCWVFMTLLKGKSTANTLAGFFLVVTHCFYGLNFLNMWPCFLAPFLYLRSRRLSYKDNLHVCMFTTAFAPLISEFLFRYTQGDAFVFGEVHLKAGGIVLALLFSAALGFIVPAILPGAKAWHKGYNLFNGGLAFGIFGFFVFNFMYKTMGLVSPGPLDMTNDLYEATGRSYGVFVNLFFILVFSACLLAGFLLNGRSFRNFSRLVMDTGYSSDFADKYGMPICLMNIGLLGTLLLVYVDVIVHFTPGAGFTGPTVGAVLAVLTFTAMGQHCRNVWPILAGYCLLYFTAMYFCHLNGRELTWSISTQGYISAAAFATGLCPIVGHYGIRAGLAAGFICASMCTATSALHGGYVLYNGGFTAGITALVLLPVLEHYIPEKRERIRSRGERLDHALETLSRFSGSDDTET